MLSRDKRGYGLHNLVVLYWMLYFDTTKYEWHGLFVLPWRLHIDNAGDECQGCCIELEVIICQDRIWMTRLVEVRILMSVPFLIALEDVLWQDMIWMTRLVSFAFDLVIGPEVVLMLFSEYIFFPRFDFMIWQEMICIQFLICWFRFYMYVIWFLSSLEFYYLTYDIYILVWQ